MEGYKEPIAKSEVMRIGLIGSLGLVLAAHAVAKLPEISVSYLNAGTTASAYREGTFTFVPESATESWGWKVLSQRGRAQVQAEGRSFSLFEKTIDGAPCICLEDALAHMDGEEYWDKAASTLRVFGKIRVIRFLNGHLMVSSSMRTSLTERLAGQGTKLEFTFTGARLSTDLVSDLDPGIEATEGPPGTVVIDVHLDHPVQLPSSAPAAGTDFDLDTTLPAAIPAPGTESQPMSGNSILKVTNLGKSETDFAIDLPHPPSDPPTYKWMTPTEILVTLPGVATDLDTSAASALPGFKSITAAAKNNQTTLDVQMAQPMGMEVSNDGSHLSIRVVRPPVGNGKLAGKIIVVDPGHGGQDTGATDPGSGVDEKNLTLAISKKLAADLTDQGAIVIMTRKTDVFIPLTTRADIAEENHADLFLCVHINSNGRDTTTRGSITFFHNHNPISATLAECIEHQLGTASKIPPIGIWSDTRIYHSGFSVLRNTTMPGVLMELGFINNRADRSQLVQDSVESSIAAAIVKGVQSYLGENVSHS